MEFLNDNPLAIFEKIDIANAKLDTWEEGVINLEEFDGINDRNFEHICKYAVAQFDFIKDNVNLSGYYLVDWRVKYANLEAFILEDNALDKNTLVREFTDKYDEAASLLYERLALDY